jgi:hypothetical protein
VMPTASARHMMAGQRCRRHQGFAHHPAIVCFAAGCQCVPRRVSWSLSPVVPVQSEGNSQELLWE